MRGNRIDNKLSINYNRHSFNQGGIMQQITLQEVMKSFENQSDLARKLNVSRQAVSVWFKDNKIPKLRQFEIQEILNRAV